MLIDQGHLKTNKIVLYCQPAASWKVWLTVLLTNRSVFCLVFLIKCPQSARSSEFLVIWRDKKSEVQRQVSG